MQGWASGVEGSRRVASWAAVDGRQTRGRSTGHGRGANRRRLRCARCSAAGIRKDSGRREEGAAGGASAREEHDVGGKGGKVVRCRQERREQNKSGK